MGVIIWRISPDKIQRILLYLHFDFVLFIYKNFIKFFIIKSLNDFEENS